jgi:hypothetical protein
MLKEMKVMRKSIVVFMAVLLSAGIMQAQVRIGQNEAPRNGAILDLSNESGGYKGGLLLPKINIDDLGKIPQSFSNGPATRQDTLDLAGLIVWNTRRNFEGVYMWDGTGWKRLYPNCSAPPVGLLASLYGTKDADGNLWIDIPSGLDARGPISPFKLTVTSNPLGSLTTVTDTYNGGVVFNPTQTWTTGQLSASPTVYDNLQAEDMSSGTGAVTADDPWKTRQTVLTFSGKAGCPPVTDTRTVTLNQTNYAIRPSVSQIILRNANDNNFTIDANVAWKVKSIDDPYGIMNIDQTTTATTGGENNKTTSENFSVTSTNKPDTKHQLATITLEDANVPKKAMDVNIRIMSCQGQYSPVSNITKIADNDQTAAGDLNWDIGATQAEKVVRHLAKKNPNYQAGSDPAYMENIYGEFLSADFGPAGRWMTTNLAAFMYDPDRTSTDTDILNFSSSPDRTNSQPAWMFPNTGNPADPGIFNALPYIGLLYNYAAATNNRGTTTNKYTNGVTPANVSDIYFPYSSETGGTVKIQGPCPSGWHMPSAYELTMLYKELARNSPLYCGSNALNGNETNGSATTDIFQYTEGTWAEYWGVRAKWDSFKSLVRDACSSGNALPWNEGGFAQYDDYIYSYQSNEGISRTNFRMWTASFTPNANGIYTSLESGIYKQRNTNIWNMNYIRCIKD